MSSPLILEQLFSALPAVKDHHAPGSPLHGLLKQVARREVERLFSGQDARPQELKPFGSLVFPYRKMGTIDSLDLLTLDELIIFSFYWIHRGRYRRVLDIGANIGLHTLLLDKCGYEVRAYEPDPKTFEILKNNVALNGSSRVQLFNAAVSSKAGTMEFVRVLGNTTGSHLAGSKPNPYGDLERFPVSVEAVEALLPWADLVKIDVEGHERELLLATRRDHWVKSDAFVEIGSEVNARAIYEHFQKLRVNLFSQKTNWKRVRHVEDVPTGYQQGILFITAKDDMPWYES